VCGCKRIMCVVANGLWLVFLVKMRPSDAIFGLCVLFANGLRVWVANGLRVWLQMVVRDLQELIVSGCKKYVIC